MSKYYARNDNDRSVDATIRNTVREEGNRSHIALYLQGQEELNLLREMVDNQEKLMAAMIDIIGIVRKIPELYETTSNTDKVVTELCSEVDEGMALLNRKMNDLLEYICETEEKGCCSNSSPVHVEIAMALAKDKNIKAKLNYREDPSELHRQAMLAWDYILCCLEACKN